MSINKVDRQILKKTGFLTSLQISNHIFFDEKNSISTNGLIDTGASVTLVDFQVVRDLNPKIIGDTKITTPSGSKEALICPLKITFLDIKNELNYINTKASFFPNSELLSLGLCGVIIGRDVLQYFKFNWNGPEGKVNIDQISFK